MVKIVLTLLGGFFVGAVLSFILCRAHISRLRHKIIDLRRGKHTKPKVKMETTKKVIWLCLFNGIAWVWFSYILAALDKMQIAESLSQVAVTEIIGVVLAYCIKSVVENLSKNNRWPDRKQEEPDSFNEQGGSHE